MDKAVGLARHQRRHGRRRGTFDEPTKKRQTDDCGSPSRTGRYGLLAGIAFAAFLALVSCSSSPAANPSPAANGKSAAPVNVSLVLDWTWQPYHVPFMYGITHGIFKAHGINLTLTQGQGSTTTATLVGQGKYPFGFADTSTAVIAAEQGCADQGRHGDPAARSLRHRVLEVRQRDLGRA